MTVDPIVMMELQGDPGTREGVETASALGRGSGEVEEMLMMECSSPRLTSVVSARSPGSPRGETVPERPPYVMTLALVSLGWMEGPGSASVPYQSSTGGSSGVAGHRMVPALDADSAASVSGAAQGADGGMRTVTGSVFTARSGPVQA